jgi:hypothetical protein
MSSTLRAASPRYVLCCTGYNIVPSLLRHCPTLIPLQLMLALESGWLEGARMLLSAGADTETRLSPAMGSALHMAVERSVMLLSLVVVFVFSQNGRGQG